MLAGLIALRLRLDFVSALPQLHLDYALASISCEHCRSSRNNPHYAPRHIIYYYICLVFSKQIIQHNFVLVLDTSALNFLRRKAKFRCSDFLEKCRYFKNFLSHHFLVSSTNFYVYLAAYNSTNFDLKKITKWWCSRNWFIQNNHFFSKNRL